MDPATVRKRKADSEAVEEAEEQESRNMQFYMMLSCLAFVVTVVTPALVSGMAPGSGVHAHSIGSSVSMIRRLPDIHGQVLDVGHRAYRLLNWQDMLQSTIHCSKPCFMELVASIAPWYVLPQVFSEDFFNPDVALPGIGLLEVFQANAAARNPRGSGRDRATDVHGAVLTVLSNLCQVSSYTSQAEINVMSRSAVRIVMQHVSWSIYMAHPTIIEIPSAVRRIEIWNEVPSCMRAYFPDTVIWAALDNTLQPCPRWVAEYPLLFGNYWNGRKQYNDYVFNQVSLWYAAL